MLKSIVECVCVWIHERPRIWSSEFRVFHPSDRYFKISNVLWLFNPEFILPSVVRGRKRDIDKHSCTENISTVYKYKFWLHLLGILKGKKGFGDSFASYTLWTLVASFFFLPGLVIHLWCCFTERVFFHVECWEK